MRRPVALALAAAALAGAACSTSPCQTLGERLCACTGNTSDTCKTQVENQLSHLNPSQDVLDLCDRKLSTCTAPPGAIFCNWLKTADGQLACGLSPEPISTTSP